MEKKVVVMSGADVAAMRKAHKDAEAAYFQAKVGALEFAGGGLSLTGTDTTNPSVSNYVVNGSGEATGGAAVSANQNGALTLTCDSLRIGSVGQIPFDVGVTDTINVGGVTLVFKNGILVEAY
jgi:hypothetical protein